jgi:hypothetical protein
MSLRPHVLVIFGPGIRGEKGSTLPSEVKWKYATEPKLTNGNIDDALHKLTSERPNKKIETFGGWVALVVK